MTEHTQPSPFPRQGIIDEKCSCGDLRSEHRDTVAYGHGPCSLCGCTKFTWVGFISQ